MVVLFCCILGCLLFLICIEFVYLYFPVLFCLSVSVKWLAVKTASEMTYIVSSGSLNSTPTNFNSISAANTYVAPSVQQPMHLLFVAEFVWAMIRLTLQHVLMTGQWRCGSAVDWTAAVLPIDRGTLTTSRADRSRRWHSVIRLRALLRHPTVVPFTSSGQQFRCTCDMNVSESVTVPWRSSIMTDGSVL